MTKRERFPWLGIIRASASLSLVFGGVMFASSGELLKSLVVSGASLALGVVVIGLAVWNDHFRDQGSPDHRKRGQGQGDG